jgi:hypothetical protein
MSENSTTNAGPVPDFSDVDSGAKVEALVRDGKLEPLLLLPVEFGGKQVRENVVPVPCGLAKEKARVDLSIIRPLIASGQVSRYTATPSYEGRSFIPTAIQITAREPGDFAATIVIWGEPLRNANMPAK